MIQFTTHEDEIIQFHNHGKLIQYTHGKEKEKTQGLITQLDMLALVIIFHNSFYITSDVPIVDYNVPIIVKELRFEIRDILIYNPKRTIEFDIPEEQSLFNDVMNNIIEQDQCNDEKPCEDNSSVDAWGNEITNTSNLANNEIFRIRERIARESSDNTTWIETTNTNGTARLYEDGRVELREALPENE